MKEEKYKKPESIPLEYEQVELPKEEVEKDQHYLELFLLLIISIVAAYVLFAFDIGTENLGELMTKNMVIAALIYALPTFITSSFLYERLVNSYGKKMSIVLSLIICIPLVFLLIMWFLAR